MANQRDRIDVRSQSLLGNHLFAVDAADFDGSNDFLTSTGLTGAADGTQGTISIWLRLDGGDSASQRIFMNNTGRMRVSRDVGNNFGITCATTAGSTLLDINTSGTFLAGATWRHILASWDVATAGARHLYINDVSDLVVTTFTNGTIDYTDTWLIGAQGGGTNKVNGCLAEIWFHTTYLDMSVTSNRRKFVSSSVQPMNLGPTGAVPTGGQPLVYLHLDDGETVANFATNRGSGGNYSITGSLDPASTSPSG